MSVFYSLSDEEDAVGARSSTIGLDEATLPVFVSHSQSPSALAEPSAASPFSRRLGDTLLSTPPRGQRLESPILSTLPTASSVASGLPVPQPAIERLQRIWVSERCAPELMPWSDRGSRWKCDDIVDEVCAQIEQQVSILNLLSADENTSEEEHLRLSLVQLDVERTKWLLRAFLRTRIHKIEANAQYYLSLPSAQLAAILSPLEIAYTNKYASIRTNHLSASVLDYLPEELRSLTDEHAPGGALGSMVTRPDVGEPVFVQCLEDCGGLTMPDGETAALTQGSVHILSYSKVNHLVRQGRAVLI